MRLLHRPVCLQRVCWSMRLKSHLYARRKFRPASLSTDSAQKRVSDLLTVIHDTFSVEIWGWYVRSSTESSIPLRNGIGEEKSQIIITIFVPYFHSSSTVTIPLPELVSSTCKQPEEPCTAVVDGTLLRLDTEQAYIKRIKILAILAKMQPALKF